MALKIIKVDVDKDGNRITARERLYQNEDRSRLVPQGHPEARFLFCTPGDDITETDALKYGLLQPAKNDPPAPEAPLAGKREGSEQTKNPVPDTSEIEKAERDLQERLQKEYEKKQAKKRRTAEDKERTLEDK